MTYMATPQPKNRYMYMAEILPIRRKTLYNQSIKNPCPGRHEILQFV